VIRFTANGGTFTGGTVRVMPVYQTVVPPSASLCDAVG